jgi:2,4-dienoyl-CoA reductase-like NADH-dependent reductase (Old Yellow Enzyme family)
MAATASHAVNRLRPQLFEPLTLRGLTLRNRIVVSPMAMYSADEGDTGDFHLVHLGRFALGGASLVFTEAMAVTAAGRITYGCAGLWDDEQAANLQRITAFLHQHGAAAGIQLLHAGHKGSCQRPWEGGAPLRDGGWPLVSPSANPFDRDWPQPHALSEAELDQLIDDYRKAAERAASAGFDVVELHCAHGYLLHSFLSPLSNVRKDHYGGSLENRMRFPLRIAKAVRAQWPQDRPMFVRISAVDGVGVGWAIEDSIAFAKALATVGVDAIDCSTGGLRIDRDKQVAARTPGFQVAYAARIRAAAGVPTMAVGLIRSPRQAEEIMREGKADLIALAREMLVNPNWPAEAARELSGGSDWQLWPQQFRYWLERRARGLGEVGAR